MFNRAGLIVPAFMILILVACAQTPTPEGLGGGVIEGDTLYTSSSQGQVLALNRISGDTIWRFDLQGEESERAVYGSPAINDGTLYVGGYDRRLYALSLNGVLEWSKPLDSPIVGTPVVSGNTLLIGTAGDTLERFPAELYAFDVKERGIKWRFPSGDRLWTTPVVEDGIVYFGSFDHKVYALDIETGEEIWHFETDGAITSSPLVKDGRLYIGSFDRAFYALNASDGKIVWRFDGSTGWYWANPIANDSAVFASSLDGNLYALDITSGDLLWTVQTEDRIVATPAIVGEMIAIPSDDGRLHLARLDNGTELDSCNIGSEVRMSLVVQDDIVYLGARDKAIRALKIKSNGNPDEEWAYFTDKDDPSSSDEPPKC